MASGTITEPPGQPALSSLRRLWERHRWLPFVLPLFVYLSGEYLERAVAGRVPSQPAVQADGRESDRSVEGRVEDSPRIPHRLAYPVAYSVRILFTVAAMWLVWPVYRDVPWRISGMAVPVGLIGGLAWIFICRSGLDSRLFSALGISQWLTHGARAGFDPFTALEDSRLMLLAFLAVRFAALAVIVPVVEEFFLRGFLMRFFMKAEWWTVPLGTVTTGSAIVATVYAVLSHPSESMAALVWFTMITLLYARTRNLWDCVVAHGVTNAMLGCYILIWKDWTLW